NDAATGARLCSPLVAASLRGRSDPPAPPPHAPDHVRATWSYDVPGLLRHRRLPQLAQRRVQPRADRAPDPRHLVRIPEAVGCEGAADAAVVPQQGAPLVAAVRLHEIGEDAGAVADVLLDVVEGARVALAAGPAARVRRHHLHQPAR